MSNATTCSERDGMTQINGFFHNLTSNIVSTERQMDHFSDQWAADIEYLNEVSSGVWRYGAPILFLIGITGNILITAVLCHMKFWQKPTLYFLLCLAIEDMVVLCTGLSRYWVREVFNYDVRTYSDFGCKVNLFMIYWSMDMSSWTLVCVVLERYLKTNFPLKYASIVSISRCCVLFVCVAVVLAAINLHYFFTNGLINNRTECWSLSEEFFKFEEYVFIFIDWTVLSVAPFIIMVILNICILREIRKSRRLQTLTVRTQILLDKNKKFDAKLTRMLLITSLYFLLTTTPISIYFVLDSFVKRKVNELWKSRLEVVWSFSYILQFSNYTVNFFLYNLTNASFRKNLKAMCGCKCR